MQAVPLDCLGKAGRVNGVVFAFLFSADSGLVDNLQDATAHVDSKLVKCPSDLEKVGTHGH